MFVCKSGPCSLADHRSLYECDRHGDRAYSRLKIFFDGEALLLVGQAQFSDLKDKLRLASYAYMLGMEENVRGGAFLISR